MSNYEQFQTELMAGQYSTIESLCKRLAEVENESGKDYVTIASHLRGCIVAKVMRAQGYSFEYKWSKDADSSIEEKGEDSDGQNTHTSANK